MKFFEHLKTINHHKWLVMKYCFRIGLYKQGLLHDLSKYTWTEFRIGMKYFQGTCSPNNAERKTLGYSTAWLHHKGRNKHHYEYWIDYSDQPDKVLTGAPMPIVYILEMFCDRIAASKVYAGNDYTNRHPYDYFCRGQEHYTMHPQTKLLLGKLLWCLAEKGEKKALTYARSLYKSHRSIY